MSIFRQYIAPLLIVMVFLVAMVAVSARAFLPGDMAAPAPVEATDALSQSGQSGLYAQFAGHPPIAQFFVGQFFTSPLPIGQFYIGQFYI